MDDEKKKQIESMIQAEKAPNEIVVGNPFEKHEVVEKEKFDSPPERDIPKEMVSEVHVKGMETIIREDDKVKKKILDQAERTIDDKIEELKQKSNKQTQDAVYNANSEACRNYGISESVPTWQQKMMRVGSSFWFIIYWVFASFTIAPVMVFFRGIQTFIKYTWLVIVIAIFCYIIIIIGIPLLITYFNAMTGGGM